VAGSYIVSAERIKQALNGTLAIRNSREPAAPPSSSGEIVGLCGQSGRHPYFIIAKDVLEGAVDRILRIRELGVFSDMIMEEVAAACQDLRQQTYFDTGTGCTNERLPSMVPLLPPEEIWLDNRELPLDIWRLINFDFDLVSSSVSSRLSVEDFAFSAVNQNALAFRFLINRVGNRRASFEVELDQIPAEWGVAGSKTIDVSLARLFLESGSLLTPLAVEEFTKWYGGFRYLHWIDEVKPELRVKDEFQRDSVDCRYRGLFAEETAIGVMAIVLSDLFSAAPIFNTVELPQRNLMEPGQMIADFVAYAVGPSSGNTVTIIAESKGSLGKLVSKARYERAKQQVSETRRVLFSGSTDVLVLTFGSTIRFSGQRLKSRCFVTDPPADLTNDTIEIDPVESWRVAYAQTCRFVGLELAAQQVLRGDPATLIRPIDLDRRRDRRRSERDLVRLRRANLAREHFHMELVLDLGSHALGIDSDLLTILHEGINNQSHDYIRKILDRRRITRDRMKGSSFETSLGLGCIAYSELDETTREQSQRE
jgi:hypothetical protein